MSKRNRLLVGGACLLITALAVWVLYYRVGEELLWGYWPLVLFLAAWCVIVFFLIPTLWSAPGRFRLLGWSSLSGIILGLSFPDILPTGPLVLAGFLPLLLVYQTVRQQKGSLRTLLGYCYHAFILWNIIATYWVANSALPAGLFAIVVNSALMCIPFALFYWSQPYLQRLRWLPLILYWLSFEYLHYHWELNWPWLTLGNTLASTPVLIQWYAYTGVLGGSLWIWIINTQLFDFWQHYKNTGQWSRSWFRPAVFLIAPVSLSLFQYFTYSDKGQLVEVVVTQPNIEPHYERKAIPENEQLERLITLSRQVLTDSTRFLLFPETSFGFIETNTAEQAPEIIRLRQFLNEYPNLTLISGVDAYHILSPGEADSRYTRTQQRNGQTTRFELYNAAIQMSYRTDSIAFYKKSKLVPGPELFPYPGLFSFLKPVLEYFGGTTAGLGLQSERSVFGNDAGKVAPVICYESVFGAHIAGQVRNGAGVIGILTNDAWWDNTAGHRQHFQYARLRAIEMRRSVARSANTGISGFIDQRGRILKKSKYRETTVLKEQVYFNEALSFYARHPDFIARLALFGTVIFLLNALVKGPLHRGE